MNIAVMTAPVKAAETTHIPVSGPEAFHGAAMYLAVLCYPGRDARSHARRDALMHALFDCARESVKRRQGFKRVSIGRATSTAIPLLMSPPTMKYSKAAAIFIKSENLLRQRRMACLDILIQLTAVAVSEHLKATKSAMQIRVGGPSLLSRLIEEKAEELKLDETKTMWRYWRESRPVLHLLAAFHFSIPKKQEGDRPDLLLRTFGCQHLWLEGAVKSAENRVAMGMLNPASFVPSERICLLPK